METNYSLKNWTEDEEVVMDKQLRRDIDDKIQTVKSLPPSRERSLAITKLQEAVMWLGMDLKRIHESRPCQPEESEAKEETAEEAAMAAYHRYGKVTDFKNFRGDPMPAWEDLPTTIKDAWTAAAAWKPESSCCGNPYPNSKDPSNTKIEPTADGLKL